MADIRKIEFDDPNPQMPFKEWQALYMDQTNGDLLPCVEIWKGKQLALKINSLGCKGEELDPAKPTIAFFGDSGVFGASSEPWAWPSNVKLSGYQVLNAAGEGYSMKKVLSSYQRLLPKVKFAATVVYTGWHNLIYNDRGEDFWRSILDQFAGDHKLAFCTLLCCLNDECRTRGVTELMCGPEATRLRTIGGFLFWQNMPPTVDNVNKLLDNVDRYNAFLRSYCAEKGALLIDLNAFMRPKRYEDVGTEFFDVCHARFNTFGKIGEYVAEQLAPLLGANVERDH